MTIDGVLTGIAPDFDLSDAMRRSSLKIARARLSPDHWGATLGALGWEVSKLGDDAPRLVRAAIRRLQGSTVTTHPPKDEAIATAILSAGRLIGAALLIGAMSISAAVLFH